MLERPTEPVEKPEVDQATKPPSRRGFAAMPMDRQRQLASMGGKAAHERGAAHTFTPEEAKKAGQLGGFVARDKPGHMAEIGRLGGLKRGQSPRRFRNYPQGEDPRTPEGAAWLASGSEVQR